MKVSKKWWKIRIAIWLCGFFLLTYLLIQYSPWQKWFPTAYKKNIEARYKESLAPGQALVEAIYAFKNKFGVWPDDLRDLKALKDAPEIPDGWFLLFPRKAPQLNFAMADGSYVGYDFDGDNLGWHGWSTSDYTKLDVKQAVPTTTESPEKIFERVLAGLSQKIKADSTLPANWQRPENWQNKGGFLHAHGKIAELEEFLKEAKAARANYYWPYMAAAVLEAEKSGLIVDGKPAKNNSGAVLALLPEKTPATTSTAPSTAPTPPATSPHPLGPAGTEFVTWVVNHNPQTMTHYFYVYTYARMIGDNPGALRAVELAAQHMGRKVESNIPVFVEPGKPLIVPDKPVNDHLVMTSDDDLHTRYFYMYRLARFAYEMKADELVLDICAHWAAGDEGIKNRNYSFLPLAAASNLALGNFDRAERLANDAGVLSSRDGTVWAQNLESLEKAAKAKNRAYVYVPNPDGSAPEYDVWKIFYQ